MELKIRYDDSIQILSLDQEATEQLWISFDLEGDTLTQGEKEKLIQDAWDAKVNRPEYNCWHKFNRHWGSSKAQRCEDNDGDDYDSSEPLLEEVVDDRIFYRDEIEHEERWNYEEICQWVRDVLERKPKWADAFIAVRLDGISVNDYTAAIGIKDASVVSKWLARAEKKLRAAYIRK